MQASFLEQGLIDQVLGLPLLEIVPAQGPQLAQELFAGLMKATWVNFVSPNAFLMADALLTQNCLSWPTHLKLALIGGGSEQTILQSHFKPTQIVKPHEGSDWDSEGLWQALLAEQIDWAHEKILIIKGDTGREWLAQQWLANNAQVQEIALYSRKNLDILDPYWTTLLEHWALDQQNIATSVHPPWIWLMTSSMACQYLQDSLTSLGLKSSILAGSIALTTHEKITQTAQAVGFSEVFKILPGDAQSVKFITARRAKSVWWKDH